MPASGSSTAVRWCRKSSGSPAAAARYGRVRTRRTPAKRPTPCTAGTSRWSSSTNRTGGSRRCAWRATVLRSCPADGARNRTCVASCLPHRVHPAGIPISTSGPGTCWTNRSIVIRSHLRLHSNAGRPQGQRFPARRPSDRALRGGADARSPRGMRTGRTQQTGWGEPVGANLDDAGSAHAPGRSLTGSRSAGLGLDGVDEQHRASVLLLQM